MQSQLQFPTRLGPEHYSHLWHPSEVPRTNASSVSRHQQEHSKEQCSPSCGSAKAWQKTHTGSNYSCSYTSVSTMLLSTAKQQNAWHKHLHIENCLIWGIFGAKIHTSSSSCQHPGKQGLQVLKQFWASPRLIPDSFLKPLGCKLSLCLQINFRTKSCKCF